MKKPWVYLFFIIIGVILCVILGKVWDLTKTPISPMSTEEKELVQWINIENQRLQEGVEINEKARRILSDLCNYHGRYNKNNLSIERHEYDEIFGNASILIYYSVAGKENLVFMAQDATLSFLKDKVKIFHPGEWINELQAIDIEKEKTIQKTKKLIESYS